MAAPSAQTLQRIADETGHQPGTLEKVLKLAICLPHDCFAAKGDVDAWIEETIALCRKRFAFLFDLTANEQEFLDGLLDRGEIDAELLDIASEIRTRIGNMPMLAWKPRHVRKHRGLDA